MLPKNLVKAPMHVAKVTCRSNKRSARKHKPTQKILGYQASLKYAVGMESSQDSESGNDDIGELGAHTGQGVHQSHPQSGSKGFSCDITKEKGKRIRDSKMKSLTPGKPKEKKSSTDASKDTGKVRAKNWSSKETSELLNLWLEMGTFVCEEDQYNMLAKRHPRPRQEIKNRCRTLRQAYRNCYDSAHRTGIGAETSRKIKDDFEFYEQCDEIFGTRRDVRPKMVLDGTKKKIHRTDLDNDSDVEPTQHHKETAQKAKYSFTEEDGLHSELDSDESQNPKIYEKYGNVSDFEDDTDNDLPANENDRPSTSGVSSKGKEAKKRKIEISDDEKKASLRIVAKPRPNKEGRLVHVLNEQFEGQMKFWKDEMQKDREHELKIMKLLMGKEDEKNA